MFPSGKLKTFEITTGGINAQILESGNIRLISKDIIYINQLLGNNLEETAMNVFLRLEEGSSVKYTRLIGIGSNSQISIHGNQVYYHGVFEEVAYTVIFTVIEDSFFFEVKLGQKIGVKATVFYGMDLAISNLYAVRNNEAYVCQYIDHRACETENGYVVCSRQNQGTASYIEIGSLTKNVGFSTDGFQFFGLSSKWNLPPEAIMKGQLANEVYQYEFAYIALQSELLSLEEEQSVVFYGSYLDQINGVSGNPLLTSKVKELYHAISYHQPKYQPVLKPILSFNNTFVSQALTKKELEIIYPNYHAVEKKDDEILSFFLDNHAHVVLPKKELLMERPSGNLLISGNFDDLEEVLANTTYIYGVFHSQIVCGNTSFNKLSSNQRNPLNLQKISGLRIWLKIDGEYRLLTMPAVFEMGLNYSRWIYKVKDDVITITVTIDANNPQLFTTFSSQNNIKYDILITNYLTMSQNEHEAPVHLKMYDNKIEVMPDSNSMAYGKYSELHFDMTFSQSIECSDDRIFYANEEASQETILTTKICSSKFDMTLSGNVFGQKRNNNLDEVVMQKEYLKKYEKLLKGFHLSIENSEHERIDSFNDLVYWYAHDALVHFSSPHGLEQYNGAAWGTRDVCQGPAEFFLCTQNFEKVREIIIMLFSHQYIENGNWPQWFMYDKFANIQQHESHGDIIVWPMRLVALYLQATKDVGILKEKIAYTSMSNSELTTMKYTLLEHLKKEIDSIVENFIPKTFLSCYGGGDWDDTLQPANKEYTQNMVSGWTVALTYEALNMLTEELKDVEKDLASVCQNLVEHIYQDYKKYIMKDGIPSGFLHFDKGNIRYIIHPRDEVTGMKYRLLPFNRGIISGLLNEDEKNQALEIIKDHLFHPDGVRLMDHAVNYQGGKNTYFTRAETASNFGREIGLQYCHAHIRYLEAMAKCGEKDALYQGFYQIHPIRLHEEVKNALPRQRNSYFSSSDGNFKTRYEAMENFDLLRTGEVGVKGGWRVYSSGPGIYLNQFICQFLGIRIQADCVIFDPMIPKELDGLKVEFSIKDKPVKISYHLGEKLAVQVNGKAVAGILEKNPYRLGGLKISITEITNNAIIDVEFEG